MTEMIPTWVGGDLVAVTAGEAHRRGLRHQAVYAFVMSGDEVLLQRRSLADPVMPGLWVTGCAGHPGWAESPESCAARLLRVDLGLLAPLNLIHRQQIEYRADLGNGVVEHEVVELYVAQTPQRPELSPDPALVLDTEWVPVPKLVRRIAAAPDQYAPSLRIFLADYRDGIVV